MKGRVEVIQELLRAEPESIHEKLDRKETVLLNVVDDDGNTILHLAAALKQNDTIEYLLGIKSVNDHVNVKNQSGSTALDVVENYPHRDLKTMEIREFFLEAGARRSICGGLNLYTESPPDNPTHPLPPQSCCKAGVILMRCISWFWTKYFKVDRIWLQEVHDHLITSATLTATMACQSIMSPPGGFWQEPNPRNNRIAGHAIMDSEEDSKTIHDLYAAFVVSNTIMLIATLITIMLALSGFPNNNRLFLWLLIFTVYVTITCMATSYVLATFIVNPEIWTTIKLANDIVSRLLDVFLWVFGFVLALHLCRFLVWLANKLVKLLACHRCCGPTATQDVTTRGCSHKCIGNFC